MVKSLRYGDQQIIANSMPSLRKIIIFALGLSFVMAPYTRGWLFIDRIEFFFGAETLYILLLLDKDK